MDTGFYFLITIFTSILLIGGATSTPLIPSTPWDTIHSTPVISEGMLYLIGYDQNYELHALNATTGAFIWSFSLGNQTGYFDTPAIKDHILYVSAENRMYAIDSTNGNLVWNFTAESPFEKSPVIVDEIVYGENHFKWIYALDANTGSLIWKKNIGNNVPLPGIMPAPLIGDGRIYIEGFDGNYEIYAFNGTNGNRIWNVSSDGSKGLEEPVNFISKSNGIILISRFNDTIAVNAIDGSPLWKYTDLKNPFQQPATSSANIFFVGMDGDYQVIVAIDAVTGKQIWKFIPNWERGWISSLILSKGTIYFGTGKGAVYAVDAISGKEKWNYITTDRVYYSPVVSDDVVYAGDDSGVVYAINAANGEELWVHQIGVPHPNNIYYENDGTSYYMVNATTMKKISKAPFGESIESTPVVYHGIVFAARDDFRIFALNSSTGDEKWNYKIGDSPANSPINASTQFPLTSIPVNNNNKSSTFTSVTTVQKSSLPFFLSIAGLIGIVIIAINRKRPGE